MIFMNMKPVFTALALLISSQWALAQDAETPQPTDAESNLHARFAAYAMFGIDYLDYKPNISTIRGFDFKNDWYSVSENPLVFHRRQGDSYMEIRMVSNCSYTATIKVNKPAEVNGTVRQFATFDFAKLKTATLRSGLGSWILAGKSEDAVWCQSNEEADGTNNRFCFDPDKASGEVTHVLDGGGDPKMVSRGVRMFFERVCRIPFKYESR